MWQCKVRTTYVQHVVTSCNLLCSGFSVIELVQHPRTGECLALKRITCHSIEDENAAREEIRLHEELGSERVLELRGSEITGAADIVHGKTSTALLLMPLYKKGTLHDTLQLRSARNDPYSMQEAMHLFLQVHNFFPQYVSTSK